MEGLDGMLAAVESYLVRRLFVSLGVSDDNRLFLSLSGPSFVDELSKPAHGWPDDDEFREAIVRCPLWFRSHPEQRRLVLAALEGGGRHDLSVHAVRLVSDLVHAYDDTAADDWPWFEDTLTYSNAVLPYALLVAAGNSPLKAQNPVKGPVGPNGAFMGSKLVSRAREVGLQSLDFLLRVSAVDGTPAPIGNNGWYRSGGERALYDQQCVDAAAMVIASATAFQVTKDNRYRDAAYTWWEWFFGKNTNHRPLYRPEDGAVYDGLTPEGVNENRGAESVLAFLLAHLALAGTFCGAPRAVARGT
jgi:hypothetical protein